MEKPTIITRDFNIHLLTINTRHKMRKDIEEFNNTINQLYLIDIIGHSTQLHRIHILFNTHGACTQADHILGHKTNFEKFKNIKIIQIVFSVHRIKPEINNRKIV